MQTNFIALYRGQTVAEARLVAITAEPEIVGRFVDELTGQAAHRDDQRRAPLGLVPPPDGEATED